IFIFLLPKKGVLSETPTPASIYIVPTPPTPCQSSSGCPAGIDSSLGYTCASSYEDWLNNKTKNFWVNDEEVTYLGKQGERARQFTYWVLSHKSIDNAPNITGVWQQNRNIVYVFIIILAAIFGVSLMIQRRYFQATSVDIKDKIIKIFLLILYTTFSFSIVLFIIQLSDLLSAFFIETLGVERIFNIFFIPIDQTGSTIRKSELAYASFQGCRNLNINLTESIKTAMFLIKTTNITYFILGIMLLLRKIILWCLLILSPFLAVLIPFTFIRNIGWIWVGVFFQWVFYGPLVSLFLGLLATIWNNPPSIPFNFDFSRINRPEGFIYQTGINILYGGPAQNLTFSNTANYVDTFAEYIISLLMLWVVIFFPWWLFRIFRDYCCDGIYATKNILMSIYDQLRGGPAAGPVSPLPSTTISTAIKIPKEVEVPVKVKLETIEEIKKAKTEEISRSLNISVSKLTDIAHFETNKQLRENVVKNLNYLQNPTQAKTTTERQRFMLIKNELYNRAIKEDKVAKQILSTISSSKIEQQQVKERLIKTIPQTMPITHVVSYKTKIPQPIVNNITNSVFSSAQTKTQLINNLAQKTNLSANQVQNVIKSFAQNVNQPLTTIIDNTTKQTNLDKEKVKTVIKTFSYVLKENKDLIKEVAQQNNLKVEEVEKIITNQVPIMAEPEKQIEAAITVPPSVSIEEYEEVKKMWKQQYEKGEVPITENITSRQQWIENDIVFITNTLNKLLSADEKLRQEGLDDVGYILPIFLINNLSTEQLIVYLKAKLEAAKAVLEEKEKEKEIMEKLKSQEEKVEVPIAKKKQEEKALEMEQAL
ncbi:MAG: hypothetical protein ACPL1D_01410, partial [Microgenomates group bacterium]